MHNLFIKGVWLHVVASLPVVLVASEESVVSFCWPLITISADCCDFPRGSFSMVRCSCQLNASNMLERHAESIGKSYMTKEPLERRGLDNVKQQKTHESRKRLTHLREDVGKQKREGYTNTWSFGDKKQLFKAAEQSWQERNSKTVLLFVCCLIPPLFVGNQVIRTLFLACLCFPNVCATHLHDFPQDRVHNSGWF